MYCLHVYNMYRSTIHFMKDHWMVTHSDGCRCCLFMLLNKSNAILHGCNNEFIFYGPTAIEKNLKMYSRDPR